MMTLPNQLTPHFTASEFGIRDVNAMHPDHWGNLKMLARLLEHVRAICGHQPITITSGYRAGDPKQHGTGSAADFAVHSVGCAPVVRRIREAMDAGEMPVFGQIIAYPYERFHVHLSLANRHSGRTNEILVCVRKLPTEQYRAWDGRSELPRNRNPE